MTWIITLFFHCSFRSSPYYKQIMLKRASTHRALIRYAFYIFLLFIMLFIIYLFIIYLLFIYVYFFASLNPFMTSPTAQMRKISLKPVDHRKIKVIQLAGVEAQIPSQICPSPPGHAAFSLFVSKMSSPSTLVPHLIFLHSSYALQYLIHCHASPPPRNGKLMWTGILGGVLPLLYPITA